jgi:hypothetical protein
MADETTFANLDGSLDDDVLDPSQNEAGKQTDGTGEIDDGFADLLSASDTIEVPGMELEDPDPAPQPPASEEENEDPDDDSKLSESMKRRLLRQRRVVEQEVESRLRGEIDQEVTTLRTEVEQLRQRATPAPTTGAPTGEPPELVAMREKLKEAKDKRRQAKVEGDVDAEEAADEEVRQLDFNVRVAEATLAAHRQRQQQQGQQPAGQPPSQQATQQQPRAQAPQQPHPNIVAWSQRNAGWYGQPGHEEATAKAREIDRELWGKGYRPEDPDYFTELDRRLKKSGVKRPGDSSPSGNAGSHVAPATGAATGGQRQQSGSSGQQRVVRLSADDVRMMRSLKLDPNNREHVLAYQRG